MAHVLTADEKIAQRKPGQWSKTFLAIPAYHTIYTARLNGVPTSNDLVAEITVDTESGTRADVLADMTLYVGTTAGAYDLGMCRIRKTPIAGLFYISETSDVVWVDEAHLTVVDDYSLWQKSLRIIGSEPFMDWDVEYEDQHEDFDPVPIMGTHHVAKLSGASVDVQLGPSADTSAWVIGSSIASKNWSVTGGTLNDATATNPIATFTAVGTYLVYCLFTAANGKTFTGVRYVIIWDDDHPLIQNFVLSNGQGSFDGGYSFDVTLFSGFDISAIRKRSLVILCTEDYAENAAVVMPGQIEGAENILCVGWIADVDNSRNSEFGEVSFSVRGADYWMKQIRDYPSGLQLKVGLPEAWTDMPSLNCNRAIWHFLHWRSTATRVMDIQHTNDGRLSSQFNISRANLWERLVQVTTPVIFAAPHVDNFGRFFCFIEPQMVPVASRTWPIVMDIEDDDIQGGISWKRNDVTPLSMLFMSGINVNDTGSANSFFSMSPGHAYAHHGEEESQDNYLVESQSNSNELCGLYYGWRNNPLSSIEFKFTHSMRVLGLFPRQFFYFLMDSEQDPRGIGFEGNLIPREVNFSVDPETGFISISATMEPESFPGLSIDGDVPTMEDVDFSSPNSSFNAPALPDLPIISLLPPGIENLNLPSKVLLVSDNYGLMYSENVNNGDITKIIWKSMNSGLSSTDISLIRNVVVTPSGAVFVQTDYKVFAASGLGGAFREIASNTDDFDGGLIFDIALNPLKNEEIIILGADTINATNGAIGFGSSSGATINAKSMFLRVLYPEAVVFAGNKIHVFGNNGGGVFATPIVFNFDGSGGYVDYLNAIPGGDAAGRYAVAAGSQDVIFYWSHPGGVAYKVEDNASDFTLLTIGLNTKQGLSASPTGAYIMAGAWDGSNHVPKVSTDNGTTWLSTSLTIGPFVWENCRDDNRWLFGGGANIKITLDRGVTDINLVGNLTYAAPLINIIGIRYIE